LIIATSRWNGLDGAYDEVSVGSQPKGLAFDGANIWVANSGDNTVTKVRAIDGVVLGTYPSGGTQPVALVKAGFSMFVVNKGSNSVTKLALSDGTLLGTASLGSGANPVSITFNGFSLFVVNSGSNSVSRLNPFSLNVTASYSMGAGAGSDFVGTFGTNWVCNGNTNTVINVTGPGTILATIPVGTHPLGMTTDGNYVWVVNQGSNSVSKIDPSTNTVVGTYSVTNAGVGLGPVAIAFDGIYLWTVNAGDNTTTQLYTDGTNLGTLGTDVNPSAIAFDGLGIWISNTGANTLIHY
jgi:YVTN family beta-propeller protein